MKITILAIAVLFATTIAFAQGINPGDDLPSGEIVLKNTNGKATSLKGAAGKNGLLVIFSCNTCPYVIKNEPVIKKTLEYAAANNIGVVIINSNEARRDGDDSYDAMAKYAKSQNFKVPYLADDNSRLADLFGAMHTPQLFLFNNKMKLAYKGAMNDNPGNPGGATKTFIEDAINAVVAGKDPDPNTTRSVGCSIKRKA
ncbi:MAG: thioredoxin family protein [Flavipsychrobacter sp.]|jgi:peroxiredoxin|nr:thioredoxin family protein [Flavipsychrobacter sp.]